MKDNQPLRDMAGCFTLPEDSGPIIRFQGCESLGFLEIYTAEKTYRNYTPESLDPERKDPDMGFALSHIDDIGSRNVIVAQVFLQSIDILNVALFENEVDKDTVIVTLHECKESLLSCFKIENELRKEIEDEIKKLVENGAETQPRMINIGALCWTNN